jgi:pimeloyl-ACP methyl ester carboxylesterase
MPFLRDHDVLAPDRAMTGNMEAEIDRLAPLCEGAIVVGVSGGATLGLELAARGVEFEAALLHEPAAGSLAPGLLAHVARGFEEQGVEGFGRALYGPAWSAGETTANRATVAREFAMFAAFEPAAIGELADRIILSWGSFSPHPREQSVSALSAHLTIRTRVIQGASHAAHLEAPRSLAEAVLEFTR